MSADLTAGATRAVTITVPVNELGEIKIEIVGAADKAV
jgi:hypothetical protein